VACSSPSVESTERLGGALAAVLSPGDVVALVGPLGSGKTRFVTGLAAGLEARARVRSPSFTLINEYRGRMLLLHLDLYRIDPMDVPGLGLDEELERGALVVEWGDKLPATLRDEALEIRFEVCGPDERRLVATAVRGRGIELLEAWRECLAKMPGGRA
jgi:tRNA threonylcarbamoyladenosine biosynthesis protein TsaE